MDDQPLAFPEIYATYQPKILRYLTRLVGDYEAEDLTQEVFVKVNQALADFKGEAALSTWLYRIATHAAIDRLRSPSTRRSAQMNPLPDDLTDKEALETEAKNIWTGEKALSAEQQLVRQQMNECIRDFIGRLPEHYRTVLVLSELEEISDKEIAGVIFYRKSAVMPLALAMRI